MEKNKTGSGDYKLVGLQISGSSSDVTSAKQQSKSFRCLRKEFQAQENASAKVLRQEDSLAGWRTTEEACVRTVGWAWHGVTADNEPDWPKEILRRWSGR